MRKVVREIEISKHAVGKEKAFAYHIKGDFAITSHANYAGRSPKLYGVIHIPSGLAAGSGAFKYTLAVQYCDAMADAVPPGTLHSEIKNMPEAKNIYHSFLDQAYNTLA